MRNDQDRDAIAARNLSNQAAFESAPSIKKVHSDGPLAKIAKLELMRRAKKSKENINGLVVINLIGVEPCEHRKERG